MMHRLWEGVANQPAKTLILLDPRISQNLVNWNDPFLQGPAIFCRDLKEKNDATILAFPNHRPFYFTIQTTAQQMNVSRSFELLNHAPPEDNAISFFEAALSFETLKAYPEMDCFDFFYLQIFTGQDSRQNWNFLEQELIRSSFVKNYKGQFRVGLIHALRFILLPKIAYEADRSAWKASLDYNQMREELYRSKSYLKRSGLIGVSILSELQKAEIRMDANEDEKVSNDELWKFLSHKLRF